MDTSLCFPGPEFCLVEAGTGDPWSPRPSLALMSQLLMGFSKFSPCYKILTRLYTKGSLLFSTLPLT